MSNLAHNLDPSDDEAFNRELLSRAEQKASLSIVGDDDSSGEAGSSTDNVTSLDEFRKKKQDSAGELRNQEDTPSRPEETGLFNTKDDRTRLQRGKAKIVANRAKLTVITTLVGVLMAISSFFILQGPNLIMAQLRDILLTNGRTQVFQSRRHRWSNGIRDAITKDGRISKQIMKEMGAKGYTFELANNGKSMAAIIHPDGTRITGDAMSVHIDGFIELKHPLRFSRWKTRRMTAFYNRYDIPRTSNVNRSKAQKGADGKPVDAEKVFNKESGQDILEGDETDVTEIQTNKSTNQDAQKKTEEDARIAAADEQGGDIGDELQKSKDEIINNGTPVEDLKDGGLTKAITESGDTITKELDDVIKNSIANQGVGSKMISGLNAVANPLEVADKACTVDKRITTASFLARAAKSAKLLRYAAVFINATDDNRLGNGSPALNAQLMKRIMSEDANGMPISASPSWGYMTKQKFSKSRNDSVKSIADVSGKPAGLFAGIQSGFSKIPAFRSTCPVVGNVAVQAGATVASVAASIFTGGGAEAIKQSFRAGFTIGIRKVVEEFSEKILTKEVAKAALKSVAKEITFESIMVMSEMYVQKSLKLPFTGQEKGGQLGTILSAGTSTANKQRSLMSGFVPATRSQYAAAQSEYLAWAKEEQRNASFSERVLSMENTNSLLFNASMAAAMNTGMSVSQASRNMINTASAALNPNTLLSGLTNIFTPKASAADEISFDIYTIEGGANDGLEMATDPAGVLQTTLRPDIAAAATDANKDALVASKDIDPVTFEPTSNAFLGHMENCVTNMDQYSQLEGDDSYDCLAKQAKTVSLKGHLLWLDTNDGLDADLFSGEIASASSSPSLQDAATPATSTPTPGAGGTGPIDIAKTSVIPGTSERIATDVLPQFTQMLAAAQASGINLLPISSGWRDPQEQIALRKQNCPNWQTSLARDCTPPTAKPGTSNHEGGRAIDFGQMCYPKTTCPGNKRWEWLRSNASKYGFYPISSEAWHWSTTGR